jgi:hypothetical protein
MIFLSEKPVDVTEGMISFSNEKPMDVTEE